MKEALAAFIVGVFQEDLRREVPKLVNDMFGTDIASKFPTLVTDLVIVVALYGLDFAYRRFKGNKTAGAAEPAPPAISGNYNRVIHIGGNLIGVSADELASAVERAIPDKERPHLAKRSLAFIRAAKREHGAAIEGGGTSIDAGSIEEAPSDLDIEVADDPERQDPYERQAIVIHALDDDRIKSGWAGHLPGVWERRLRTQI